MMPNVLDRLNSLRVRDVMTKNAVCVRGEDGLDRAAEIFADKAVSCVPVVDSDNRCVGILSAVDFVDGRRMPGFASETNGNSKRPRFVREIMSTGVRSVTESELLLKAAQLMCAKHIHRLPVLDDSQHVVGIISTLDVVSAMINAIDEANASRFRKDD